jgi:GH25 family lysozyme M1 (1,4-beta-N-acetylmuramidase)
MLLGIDVSHWQGTVNFERVKAAGAAFSICKLTEGVEYVDPTAMDNRMGAKKAGLFSGMYHFAKGTSATGEADHFASAAGTIDGEFTVLDWEVNITSDPVEWCLTWLQRVEQRLGVKPFIYMDQSRLNQRNWSRIVANGNPLWLAKYDGMTDIPDTSWRTMMKQYTDKGKIDGVNGYVDCNCFYGFEDDLSRYRKGGPGGVGEGTPWTRLPTLNYGMRGNKGVESLQRFMRDKYRGYNTYSATGNYLDQTAAGIAEFQRRTGITGPDADGKTVGPRTKRALWDAGWRG